MICFFFSFSFLSLLNLKLRRATHFSQGIKMPLSEVALQTRESLKRPYFPLPLSIPAGSNLIMGFIFLFYPFHPHSIPKQTHPPFDFRENPC